MLKGFSVGHNDLFTGKAHVVNKEVKCTLGRRLRSYRLYKPFSDWLERLPHRITGLNMKEYFILDIHEMERNDLWLNMKGN